MELSRSFLESSLNGVILLGTESGALPDSWTVDSRELVAGAAFVAILGKRVDGHEFIPEALRSGARLIIAEERRLSDIRRWLAGYEDRVLVICVPDSVKALIALASAWRQQFSYPVVGITGSIGKTTTKEMIGALLRAAGRNIIISEGNNNTAIGMALHMLRMRSYHTCAVFEMGISRRGEMARLSELLRPTIGIITAIAHSHMEGLGALSDIAVEKRDIFKHMGPGGIGIVNGDQALLGSVAYAYPIIRFGTKITNQVQARQVRATTRGIEFVMKVYGNRYNMVLSTENVSRVYHVLAAAALGHFLGVSEECIVRVLQDEIAVPGRFRKCGMVGSAHTLVDDACNANPESMRAALIAFERMSVAGKKYAILGDMKELGVNSPFWHRQLGRLLRKAPSVQHVIFVGEHVKWASKTVPYGLSCEVVATWSDAVAALEHRLRDESACTVLVKGSLSVGLRQLVHHFSGAQ